MLTLKLCKFEAIEKTVHELSAKDVQVNRMENKINIMKVKCDLKDQLIDLLRDENSFLKSKNSFLNHYGHRSETSQNCSCTYIKRT